MIVHKIEKNGFNNVCNMFQILQIKKAYIKLPFLLKLDVDWEEENGKIIENISKNFQKETKT